MFVPIVLGSDKTTVSVATGHNEYWPVYMSIGNVHNNVRRAHRGALVPIAFLSIPTGEDGSLTYINKSNRSTAVRTDAEDPNFRGYRRHVFHSSLSRILESLRPGMETPEVVRCPDNHFRRAIYGIGPYIADYPEQVLLSCIVQGWCSRYVVPLATLS
jgi:Plavaka transposase